MLMTKRDLKTNPQPGLNGALFVVARAGYQLMAKPPSQQQKSGSGGRIKLPS